MRKDLIEIKPGIGLGVLKFGMSKNQVKMILGKPEDTDTFYMTESEDSESEAWYYDSQGLSVSFDAADDWKLITIEIDAEEYTLKGKSVFGKSKEELKGILKELNITDLEHEEMFMEEAPTHELISTDSLGINFWLDENAVSEIQWGPFFNTDESIRWPDQN